MACTVLNVSLSFRIVILVFIYVDVFINNSFFVSLGGTPSYVYTSICLYIQLLINFGVVNTNKILLGDLWVKVEITKEIRKYFELK